MAKTENHSHAVYPKRSRLGQDQEEITETLRAVFFAMKRDVPQPNPDAITAATQYRQIKGALRTHSEPSREQDKQDRQKYSQYK